MHIIFDLDGTIADIEHRRWMVDKTYLGAQGLKPDWTAFFEACVRDKPNLHVIYLMTLLHQNNNIIDIWSGRSESVRPQTEAWLKEHQVPYQRLIMRPAQNFIEDEVLKKSWILQHGRPDLVFDDRTKVVEMWRKLGIPCFQVAPGDF